MYHDLASTLRETWFKQWFWVIGGALTFNPLHFDLRSGVEQSKMRDIVSLLTKSGNIEFTLEDRLDTLDQAFNKIKEALLLTKKLVNRVTIPDSSGYFNFSANVKIKYKNDKLKQSLHLNENKRLVVHNIPADRRLGLREDTRAFADRSPFQESFEEVVSQLGELAVQYGKLMDYGFILDFFLPRPKYDNSTVLMSPGATEKFKNSTPVPGNILSLGWEKNKTIWKGIEPLESDTVSITVLSNATKSEALEITIRGFTIKGAVGEFVADKIRELFRAKGLYDVTLFAELESDTTRLQYVPNALISLDSKLGTYLELLMKRAAEQVKSDSITIASFLNVYLKTSSPVTRRLTSVADKAPAFYSDVIETTSSDAAIENVVRPYTVKIANPTDTSVITKFSYKVGKSRKFTLSAGIVYTLNSYDQSVATKENGTIKISNDNRLARLIVGLNYYLTGDGLFNQDNEFWGKGWDRMYLFFGVGLPQALENLYIGLGRDLFPGLKLTTGLHIAKHNKYFIQNNEILEQRFRYQLAGPFISLKVDPTSLIKLFDVFKKKSS
jgi:hypothetical protein